MKLNIVKEEQFRLCDDTIGQIWLIELFPEHHEQVYFIESSLGLNFEISLEHERPIAISHNQEDSETLSFDLRQSDHETDIVFHTSDVMDFLAIHSERRDSGKSPLMETYHMQIYINYDEPNPFIPEESQ